jgi:hypothetical protein
MGAIELMPSWTTLEALPGSTALLEWPDPQPQGPRLLVHPPLLAAVAQAADSLQWRTKVTVEIHLPLAIRQALASFGQIRDDLARLSIPNVRILKADIVEVVKGKYSSLSASSVSADKPADPSVWKYAMAQAHAAKIDLDLMLVN